MKARIVRARKITNRICAIEAAAPASPPKPSAAAASASTKNTSAHPSITHLQQGVTTERFTNACARFAFLSQGDAVDCPLFKEHRKQRGVEAHGRRCLPTG